MFVTKLIQDKKYKEFILKKFPKPRGYKNEESKVFINRYHSIVGNSFEIFFKLLLIKYNGSNLTFENEIKTANTNIKWLKNTKNAFYDLAGVRNIIIDDVDFLNIQLKIKKFFKKDSYMEIESDKIKRIEVFEKNVLKSMKFLSKEPLPLMNSFQGNPFVIFSKEDVVNHLQKTINCFEKEVKNYTNKNIISNSLILTILKFTNISNQFFSMAPSINHNFSKNYLSQLKDIINKVYLPIESEIHKKDSIFKPDLSWQKIRARPDFLIGNVIVELKTSNSFLSTNDYLQSITYLLFANQISNSRKYGKIDKLIIYYPILNTHYEIPSGFIKMNRNEKAEFKNMILEFIKKGNY